MYKGKLLGEKLKPVICDNQFFFKGTHLFNFIQDNIYNTCWNKINDLRTSIKS
jgi:hypothetical protein